MNKLFGKRPEQPKPVETPEVMETPKPVETPKVVETPKPLETPKGVTAPAKSEKIQEPALKEVTAPISIKEKVKEGEKWLKHIDGSANHLLYTIKRKNSKTGLEEKVTVCTEVDCEKNKSQ